MAHHTIIDPKYLDPKEKRDKKLRKQGLFLKKDPLKEVRDKIAYKKIIANNNFDDFENSYPKPMQLGNINSLDGLTMSLINPAGIAATGFNLSKKMPSIMQGVLKKGKKLVVNFGDDILGAGSTYISSLGKQTK